MSATEVRTRTPFRTALALVAIAAAVFATAHLSKESAGGRGPDTGSDRIERQVTERIDLARGHLQTAVDRLASSEPVRQALQEAEPPQGRLFELLRQGLERDATSLAALTLYWHDGRSSAWAGRSSLPPSRGLVDRPSMFVVPGALTLRLVHVAPVVSGSADRRLGQLAGEVTLGNLEGDGGLASDRYVLDVGGIDVEVHAPTTGSDDDASRHTFVVPGPDGRPLLLASVTSADIASADGHRRARLKGLARLVAAAALLVLAIVPLGRLRAATSTGAFARALVGFVAALAGALGLSWGAGLPPAVRLLLLSTTSLALVALGGYAIFRARALALRRLRAGRLSGTTPVSRGLIDVMAGTVAAAVLLALQSTVAAIAAAGPIDVLHLSLHPWDLVRLSTISALVLAYASGVWVVVLLFAAVRFPRRLRPSGFASDAFNAVAWVLPTAILTGLPSLPADVSPVALLLTVVACAAVAWRGERAVAWYRRASQASRLVVLYLLLVGPALLLYPALLHSDERVRTRLVEREFAPQATGHTEQLQRELTATLSQLDVHPDLPAVVASLGASPGPPTTDAAFALWKGTALGQSRLTSSIELYAADARLVSRFALNLPEYGLRAQQWQAQSCEWEVFGEAAPFGAEERRMLHAERGVCQADGSFGGAVVIHVMPDYNALPFLSSQSPYFELFRSARGAAREGEAGRDVGLILYGWGRTTLYSSTGSAWPLDDALFSRIYRSREPFWTEFDRAGVTYRAFVANDRSGIFVLHYPRPGFFQHLVHLAELTTLGVLGFLVLMGVMGVANRLGDPGARPGREILREVRTSFYRKLFLAFVAASVVPVVILAVAVRAYVASRLRADVEAEAARTVSVARRVIEESLALQPSAGTGSAVLDDDALVWISRVINQDVNLFEAARLSATSERDLFASGLLPTRVADDVYRAIALERLPTYVGEDEILDFRYLTAAAPVRAAGRDAIVTVPMLLRQQEIEREIDELDQGVRLGALVFILLGAGIGFWMAERIGDPVQRLTRASRRIAAGDLDARVFVRSADELQRLVESFNAMAFELKRQRAQLERTNRLEAWAEMARQVAHDIKNPLTPIQLAAEHLRRVHVDRGEPLAPVLDGCVETILLQVRLLRQIAAEFSSFATTPVPRSQPGDIGQIVREVVGAYAVGLGDRVAVDVAVEPGLPLVEVDRTLFSRALSNIVENALHAMPAGGRLDVSVVAEPQTVAVAVRDTGVGMDEDALARVFEPYFSTKATGTGLGLTIAKRNVELMEGTIEVGSRKNDGTTVTLRLPVGAVPPGGGSAGL